uniref:Ferritin n=1 Tax=Callorhinchus milii TaxID=7868 RepID=A0A4W3GWE4_CALMI
PPHPPTHLHPFPTHPLPHLCVCGVLWDSYYYSCYFDRDDVALPHFSGFYKERSHKERSNAEKLMTFQNQRGGRIILQDIKKPENDEWSNGLEAMQCALQLEKSINQCLLDLHKLGCDKKDPYLCHFLETDYLRQQAETMKTLGGYISRLERLGAPANSMAEYLFDRHTLAESS